MAKYIKQEMPDIRKTGEQQCYYRMETECNIGTKELLEQMSYDGSSLDRGKIQSETHAALPLRELTSRQTRVWFVAWRASAGWSAAE